MAIVHVFQNPGTGDFWIVPFAKDKDRGINVASGKMIHLVAGEFSCELVRNIRQCLTDWSTRDSDIRSELYEEMPPEEREQFLGSHKQIIVSSGQNGFFIYSGRTKDKFALLKAPTSDGEWLAAVQAALAAE